MDSETPDIEPAHRRAPLVLVAEDDEDTRNILLLILARSGYDVIEASDGEEAVLAARKHRPHLILMDLMMPRLDGLTALLLLKANRATADIPVVAVTARAFAAGEDEVLSAFDGYIKKPIVPLARLLNEVQKWAGPAAA